MPARPAPTPEAPASASASASASAPRRPPPNREEPLSPSSAALAHATDERAARAAEVTTGSLRVRVLQVTDLPTADATNGHAPGSSTTSWLRAYAGRRSPLGRTKVDPTPRAVCVLVRVGAGRLQATEALPRAETVFWLEEFLFEGVSTAEELKLYCFDRTCNGPHASLPTRDDPAVCPGFIGRVSVPLVRLPEGEEVEQWYPLVAKEPFQSLRAAMRVALCFVPVGGRTRSRADSAIHHVRPPPLLTTNGVLHSGSGRLRHPVPPSPVSSPLPVSLPTGIVDYVIVVGPEYDLASRGNENGLLFRYPVADRPGFALPTKIEWFCFPGGPEVVVQAKRPRSKLFSFVLVGGADGISRCYVICMNFYRLARESTAACPEWHGTCIAFLTRVPLLNELTTCLLCVTSAWLQPTSTSASDKGFNSTTVVEKLVVDLCFGLLLPVRGVLGVRFCLNNVDMSLVLPSSITIYSLAALARNNVSKRYPPTQSHAQALASEGVELASPKQPDAGQVPAHYHWSLPPLVYSLSILFDHIEVKMVIELVTLILCEYRILLHSSKFSLLCPIAEGLCALIYPFRWQHPYIPILPRVLAEYVQAPLPYILGIHSSWLSDLLDQGRPEHLVVVDIDRGHIHHPHDCAPVALPTRLTKGLYTRVHRILHPDLYTSMELGVSRHDARAPEDRQKCLNRRGSDRNSRVERLVRLEFVSYLATLLIGYRDCLFFVNQKLPVFNKRRFFTTWVTETESIPLLTRLFCTQAFQSFLENHTAADLSVFHTIYLAFIRAKEVRWPEAMPTLPLAFGEQNTGDLEDPTPIYDIDKKQPAMKVDANISSDNAALGEMIETYLDRDDPKHSLRIPLDALAMDTLLAGVMNEVPDYRDVSQNLGVDRKTIEDYSDLLRRPHEVNQQQILSFTSRNTIALVSITGTPLRTLSDEDERTEQIIHRCLTSVFTSDDSLSQDDIKCCETRFKQPYARELFVLILMQPSQNLADTSSPTSTSRSGSSWFNPKGSGSCIGDPGFQLLARLSSQFMDQCAVFEDFTNARGMLQVATQYYRVVEDKRSGFATKEYLVMGLRHRPICRSLDMWQHACSREIDIAASSDPAANDDPTSALGGVSDETFFSVIGSLIYDMLTVEVPVAKVQAFVGVMCSTYQKGQELLETLHQLVDNVGRALDLSKDSKASPSSSKQLPLVPSLLATASAPAPASPFQAPTASTSPPPATSRAPSPPRRSQYDLDTVIRRKMSVHDPVVESLHGVHHRMNDSHHGGMPGAMPLTRRAPTTVLYSRSSPIHAFAMTQGRIACGHRDASLCVLPGVVVAGGGAGEHRRTVLEGHTAPIVAVRFLGATLISCARDHTLRTWDLQPTARRRHLFGLFSHVGDPSSPGTAPRDPLSPTSSSSPLSSSTSPTSVNGSAEGGDALDGPSISRRSAVMRGHSGPVTCLEIGRQLTSNRALVASGSLDATIRLWDPAKEASVAVLAGPHARGGGIRHLRHLAHGDALVSTCDEFALRVWDVPTARLRASLPQSHRGAVRDLQLTVERVVTAANDRTAKVWDAQFRQGDGAGGYTHALRGHGGPVLCLALGGPADPNVCTGAADGLVRVWDLRYVQKGPRLVLGGGAVGGHTGAVTCLQRDFTRLVSAGEDGHVRVWDLNSGRCLRELRPHMAGITAIALHDANVVFSVAWDGALCVSELDTRG